jgi:hypothetical protein
LSGGELQKRQRESYDLIKGKGLLGYSTEEAAQLEKDLGLTL